MATNNGFVCPYDASQTLMADIAAQLPMPSENVGGGRRDPPLVERNEENDDFVFPEDAPPSLMVDIKAQPLMLGDGFVSLEDATPSLRADLAAQPVLMAAHEITSRERHGNTAREREDVRSRKRPVEDVQNEPLERIQNVIRSSIQVGDCQNREFVSAIEQLGTLFKREDPETFAAQQVIRTIIGNNIDNALASIFYGQLTEGLRYYKTSRNFGGNLNNVISKILEFFDIFTLKSLDFSRHAADTTCLVEAIKFILTKFKTQHFQNTSNGNIQKFLYLGLKLSCQLLMHEDDTVLISVKDKRLVDILRLYISSPDPQFQLLAVVATAYLSDVGDNRGFFINPLALKMLMESVCNNSSQIPTETMALALEKLMRFEDNMEVLMELDFIANLRSMLAKDDVSAVLIGLQLLTCLSKDTSIAPLVHDKFIHILRSRCLSLPQPAVKTATSRLIDLLNEKSNNERTNIFAHGEGGFAEGHNQTTRDGINTGRHIMISYCHVDKPKAEAIHDYLVSHGFEVWIDRNSPKNDHDEMMASAVENASMVIYCISEAYKRSHNTRKELQHAAKLKKTIIPVRVGDCDLNGWLGLHTGTSYIHDLREITDGALFKLLQDISHIRTDAAPDGEMLTLRLGD